MGCLEVAPTNPVSALIVSVLGENFYPPYDLNFQPIDRSKLTEEKFLKMNTPGGGKLKPIGDMKHVHISEVVAPIAGVLGTVFAFFAPLYIILDVIRALIDIICSLFNPVPLILTVVDLFLNVVPPLIALYPPLSSILHAINAAKLIVAIVGSVVSAIIPIIFKVVEAALSIPGLLEEGAISALDNVGIQICELLQEFANALAGFGPIKFILDMLKLFMEMGSKFFCVGAPNGDSPCCTVENCPPIIINPPAGEGRVLFKVDKVTLYDLVDGFYGAILPVIRKIEDWINLFVPVINNIIDVVTDFLNSVVVTTLDVLLDAVVFIMNTVNSFVGGLFTQFINSFQSSVGSSIQNFALIPDLTVAVDITPEVPVAWKDVILVHPAMYIRYDSATSQPNENGLVSQIGFGHEFSATEMAGLQNFIIPPELIAVPLPKMPKWLGGSDDSEDEDKQDPATIKVKIVKPDGDLSIRNTVGEADFINYNTIGMKYDPLVLPGTFTTPTEGEVVGGVEFLTPTGQPHPLFVNQVPYVQGTVPTAFGDYMIDYENGAAVVFVGNDETPFSTLEYAIYGANREVLMNYSSLASTLGKSVIASAIFAFPTIEQILASLGLPNTAAGKENLITLFTSLGFGFLPLDALGILHVYADNFEQGDSIRYEILPQQIELLKNNLIGLGCQNDIRAAAEGLSVLINDGNLALPPGKTPLDPLIEKIGKPFPPPPEEELQELLDQLTEDPTTPVDPLPIINTYLDQLADFVDSVVCVGASAVQSEFLVDKPFILANGRDFATLSLNIKDQGGNQLLIGGLVPGSNFRAQFFTDFGEVGDVEFDPDSGIFFAPIRNDRPGIANITAVFVVGDRVCTSISEFSNLEVSQQVVRVEFIPEKTAYPRVRKQPQYIQSRGGRVRR